ncbi:hypothetical protein JTE90_015898 [Oedothorax gibbosus]|uniref:Uncharacterized protein n=1 Tax=Oedothorax gibbosus TaxID=931172 RepID=A0AAV6VT90_9ARAC|nr:hypothetical protein JTE90_015898 [Oedothorax gibbosus]
MKDRGITRYRQDTFKETEKEFTYMTSTSVPQDYADEDLGVWGGYKRRDEKNSKAAKGLKDRVIIADSGATEENTVFLKKTYTYLCPVTPSHRHCQFTSAILRVTGRHSTTIGNA